MSSVKRGTCFALVRQGYGKDEAVLATAYDALAAENKRLQGEPGALQRWFGLSYSSFAILPRVIMEAMPQDWQARMGQLLLEYDEVYVNRPDLEAFVQVKRDGKFVAIPDWVTNYRHPDRAAITAALAGSKEGE